MSPLFLADAAISLPREKIVTNGAAALSTPELLAVILGSGIQHVPVRVLAARVAQKIQQPSAQQLTVSQLRMIRGIGVAKACQILALLEYVERLRPLGTPKIDSLTKVLEQVNELRFLPREQVVGLYVNSRLELLMKETLAVGNLNQVALTPREIFAAIKHLPVNQMILVHNHPSGDPTPSAEDVEFTHNVQSAGKLMGVELIDHIIVAQHKHYSCKAHGYL